MIFISSLNKVFPYKEAKKLYEENKKYVLPDIDINFSSLVNGLNGNFWAVLENNIFLGCIYFEVKNNKWFLNGFSKRKTYKYVSTAINGLCNLYFRNGIETIYSETPFSHAKSSLVRSGFKKIKTNLYRKDLTNGR